MGPADYIKVLVQSIHYEANIIMTWLKSRSCLDTRSKLNVEITLACCDPLPYCIH